MIAAACDANEKGWGVAVEIGKRGFVRARACSWVARGQVQLLQHVENQPSLFDDDEDIA